LQLTDTTLPLTIERQQTEWKTVQGMAQNNNFPGKLITNLKIQMQQKIHQKQDKDKNKKWATFTYHSPQIGKIHQSLQTHQHKYCIQKHKHNTALHKTQDVQQKPGI